MTDPLQSLESELAAMRPAALTPRVVRGIESNLARKPGVWTDRCLIGAMISGAAAACVIAILLVGEGSSPVATPPSNAANGPRAGDYSLAFALNK